MHEEIILQVQDLKKYFGRVHAVDGVNLKVIRGQIYGFLGPNGSGKTTTIGMILGLIHPTGGKVTVFGKTVSPSQTKPLREVGALVGAPALVPYLSARQNLKLIARFNPSRHVKSQCLVFGFKQPGQYARQVWCTCQETVVHCIHGSRMDFDQHFIFLWGEP